MGGGVWSTVVWKREKASDEPWFEPLCVGSLNGIGRGRGPCDAGLVRQSIVDDVLDRSEVLARKRHGRLEEDLILIEVLLVLVLSD